MNPSWYNEHYPDLVGKDEVMNSKPTNKPELPGTTLKGIGLKYHLTMPRVKLNFIGTSGMLPVRINDNTEPKQLKVPLGYTGLKPDQHVKPELSSANLEYPQTTASGLYGQIPPNNFQSYKPELPGLFQNPTNYNYPTAYPELHYSKEYLSEKIQQYPSPHGTYVPEIAMSTPSYPTQGITDGFRHTVPYKEKLAVQVLNPRNLDYEPTKPVGKEDTAIELPPVPTTMSLLRQTQLVLLNTVAGLPGGNPQALESVRAK